MTRTRRKFDREFKLRAVELSYQRDNIKALSDELEIRPELLYRWRTEFANDERYSFSGNGNRKMTEEESKVVQLEKQLSDMRMERDILKKAIGIFSKSDGSTRNRRAMPTHKPSAEYVANFLIGTRALTNSDTSPSAVVAVARTQGTQPKRIARKDAPSVPDSSTASP